MLGDHHCYHPWAGIDISAQGTIKPCCKFKSTIADTISEYAQSPLLAKVRAQFTNNIRPADCSDCWITEDAGHISKRQLDAQLVFCPNDHQTNDLQVAGITFGNTCNLACRICSSFASSKWHSEEIKLQKYFPEIKIWPHNQFYKTDEFIYQFPLQIKNLSLLEITGGEPFLTGRHEHIEFLNQIIKTHSNVKNLSLHYVTNCTVFPDHKLWKIWKSFKKINIQLSIDGTNKQFEYNRWPASWDECTNNVTKYVSYLNDNSNVELDINHCVSIFTVFYLLEFVLWTKQSKLPTPWLSLLTKPSQYRICNLPTKVKEVISDKIKSIPIFSHINAELLNNPVNQFSKTVDYINALDEIRGQSFSNTFPEFSNLLAKCGYYFKM